MNANLQPAPHGKVLVIDDETAILITLKRVLRNAGYEVQTAQSAREGLSLFQQEPWDVVTIDRSMPEMNGEEAAAEMKRLAPEVPIILITGFPSAATRRELFHVILGKPFRIPELLQHLADCVQARRTEPRAKGDEPDKTDHASQCTAADAPDTPGKSRPWNQLLSGACARLA